MIRTDWENLQGVTALEDTKVRLKGGIKSPVLTEVPEGTRMYFREDLDDWYEVFTEDGYRGYVPSKTVSAPEKIQEEPVNVVPEYTSIRKDYPINLAWHQVTSAGANEMLDEVTAEMTGVNTISPTWFSIQSEDGTLSSLADASYVEKAHGKGLEVWALIDNFNKEVSTLEVLSSTPKRAYMIQQLMDSAAACGFDGINVDFESIKEEEAPHYIPVSYTHLDVYKRQLLGDPIYGKGDSCPRLMLHAWKVRCVQPFTGEALEICAPVPREMEELCREWMNQQQ